MSAPESDIRFPVFFWEEEGEDMFMFGDLRALQGQLEPWYVEVKFEAWDSEGRPCRLILDDYERIWVRLSGAPAERERLQGLMVEFARKAGVTVPEAVEGLSLLGMWKVSGAQIEGHGLFDLFRRAKRAVGRHKSERGRENVELSAEETAILEKLLAGDYAVLESLREAAKTWRVSSRVWTGVGFFIHLRVPGSQATVGERWVFGDVSGTVNGVLCGLMMFANKDLQHAMIECYSCTGEDLPSGAYPTELWYDSEDPLVRSMDLVAAQIEGRGLKPSKP